MSRSEKILRLNDIRKRTMDVMAEKGFDVRDITFEKAHEFWRRIPGDKKLQSKTATPSDVDRIITPDPGYDALSYVNIPAARTLKPYNIPKGQTVFGIEGVVEVVSNDDPTQWVVLWSRRITTTKISSGDRRSVCEIIGVDDGMDNYLIDIGDTIRITVDGVSAVYVTAPTRYDSTVIAGNPYVFDLELTPDDDDCLDYAVVSSYGGHDAYIAEFFSRYPGTYNVKIELAIPQS